MCTEKEMTKKEKVQDFIYTLFYPAILGAILYELVPIEINLYYLIKVFIAFYYCVDYCHLYYFLHSKTEIEKRTPIYFIGDVLVSLSLLFAVKYLNNDLYWITPLCFALIPLWFLSYNLELKNHIKFYFWFFLANFIFGVTMIFLFNKLENIDVNINKYLLLTFVFVQQGTYFIHVLRTMVQDKKAKLNRH